MAIISGSQALAFSNQQVRPRADNLAQFYHRCVEVQQQWNALGGGQTALNDTTFAAAIRAAGDAGVALFSAAFNSEASWFLQGTTSLIPNTADQIADGSPADGRPGIVGNNAVNVMARCTEFVNWLRSSAGSFSDTTRGSMAYLNTLMAVSSLGNPTIQVADAGNFINRCGELIANYTASSNANLNTILAAAVNPNPTS